MLENDLKALIKIQYVDAIKKSAAAKGIAGRRLQKADKKGMFDHAVKSLDLQSVLEREIGVMSGGELQRLTIALTCV